MSTIYEKWHKYIEDQISYQEFAARRTDEEGNTEASDRCHDRANKFRELLEDIKQSRDADGPASIDQCMIAYLKLRTDRRATISSLVTQFKDRGSSSILKMRISELVKRGKAYRLGDTIGLPRGEE